MPSGLIATQEQEGTVARIQAYKHESGRVEFALQLRTNEAWSERILPRGRFLNTSAPAGKWLASTPIALNGYEDTYINAFRHDDDRIEFGLQLGSGNRWSDMVFPDTRFLPVSARPNRWYSSSVVKLDVPIHSWGEHDRDGWNRPAEVYRIEDDCHSPRGSSGLAYDEIFACIGDESVRIFTTRGYEGSSWYNHLVVEVGCGEGGELNVDVGLIDLESGGWSSYSAASISAQQGSDSYVRISGQRVSWKVNNNWDASGRLSTNKELLRRPGRHDVVHDPVEFIGWLRDDVEDGRSTVLEFPSGYVSAPGALNPYTAYSTALLDFSPYLRQIEALTCVR